MAPFGMLGDGPAKLGDGYPLEEGVGWRRSLQAPFVNVHTYVTRVRARFCILLAV